MKILILILCFLSSYFIQTEVNLIPEVQCGNYLQDVESTCRMKRDFVFIGRDSSQYLSLKTQRPFYSVSLTYEIGSEHRLVTYSFDAQMVCWSTSFSIRAEEVGEVSGFMDNLYKRKPENNSIAFWQMEGRSYAALTKDQDGPSIILP